ncbi:unnamed protein product [Linum trigynum]|uniref:Uncharacterized protein n=1 Tax=Linum trigynum TaxID=586398 RepID=A0AAV2DNZ3_9ROSI
MTAPFLSPSLALPLPATDPLPQRPLLPLHSPLPCQRPLPILRLPLCSSPSCLPPESSKLEDQQKSGASQ